MNNPHFLPQLLVESKDRRYQVWQRNSEYIHYNPVKAGLCERVEDYKYSSGRFYEVGEKDWDFLEHYDG